MGSDASLKEDFLFGTELSLKWAEVFKPETYQTSRGVINGDYSHKMYDHILTIYPDMKAGLELCCGNGRRIRGGRAARKNIFGINEKPLNMMWKINGVEDFCKVGTVDKIPYKDNTFDFVCYPVPLKYNMHHLREIKRVCSDRFYLQLDGGATKDQWLKLLIEEGFYLDVFNLSDDGSFVAEGKFLRGDK